MKRNRSVNHHLALLLFFILILSLLLVSCAKSEKELIDSLQNGDVAARMSAAENLGGIGSDRAVEALKAALKDKESGVRGKAAEALEETGSANAAEALVAALQDEDSGVRGKAAHALGKIKVESAVEPLIAALKDKESVVRVDAAWALGWIGSERALEPLIAAMYDEGVVVQTVAVGAVTSIAYAHKNSDRTEKLLIDDLQNKDPRVRAYTAYLLGNSFFGSQSVVEALTTALQDKEPKVRVNAAESLAKSENASASDALMKALDDGNLRVVATAYDFYIKKGREGTETTLIAALNEFGSEKMAEEFLNCGNPKLKSAALDWAHKRGYTITFENNKASAKWGGK